MLGFRTKQTTIRVGPAIKQSAAGKKQVTRFPLAGWCFQPRFEYRDARCRQPVSTIDGKQSVLQTSTILRVSLEGLHMGFPWDLQQTLHRPALCSSCRAAQALLQTRGEARFQNLVVGIYLRISTYIHGYTMVNPKKTSSNWRLVSMCTEHLFFFGRYFRDRNSWSLTQSSNLTTCSRGLRIGHLCFWAV